MLLAALYQQENEFFKELLDYIAVNIDQFQWTVKGINASRKRKRVPTDDASIRDGGAHDITAGFSGVGQSQTYGGEEMGSM